MLPTYDQFVKEEAPEVEAAYMQAHGHPPGITDVAHNAWRRLVEGWTHENILHDIKGEPLDVVQPTPTPTPTPTPIDPLFGCGPWADLDALRYNEALVTCLCDAIQPAGSIEMALEVVARTAWALRQAGAGLLRKPAGENVIGYHGVLVSASRIAFRDEARRVCRLVKVLSDVPTTNGPSWQDSGEEKPLEEWVQPIEPGPLP